MIKKDKHIIRFVLILCALLCSAVRLSARMYQSGEKVYVNAVQNDGLGDWSQANAKLFLYFYQSTNSSNSEWVELSRVGTSNVFEGTLVPNNPWYDRVSVIRKGPEGTAGNWNNRWNQSCDIIIPDNNRNCNLLYEFYKKDNLSDNCGNKSYLWFYHPIEDPTSESASKIDQADKEVIEVCTQSVGDPFSLQPRLKETNDNYDYDQKHTWFKWDGSKWQEIANAQDKWGFDGSGGLNETIGAEGSRTYYFLSTQDHAKQRFIEISVTKDCSPTCEITDFGVVTSSVNVHDSTYSLDGVVAFGEAMDKTLRISVTDAKGEHYVDYNNPKTPFIFSLPNLYADGADDVVATASFLGSGCSRNSDPYTAPNAIEGINTQTFNITHNETVTLTPSTNGENGFKWHDDKITAHEPITPAFCFDTTLIYTYYEYEPAPTAAGNLIEDGDFSTTDESFYGTINRSNTISGSAISNYNFWGKDVHNESNFYNVFKDGDNSLFGGFSIVTNANDFWKRFTDKIDPKAGTHYALFDADNSGSRKAWFIDTGKSSKLKLAKGTNYMFSFWVANINNYGEMNNAAILQFAIRYKQNGAWSEEELLGNPIDLNNYMDNIWHQNSHVYTSPVDADEVEIMVRDLNTSKNPGGNDFALDDIQFQAISVHSQAIKHCERFVVNIEEPKVTVEKPVISITNPKCSETEFSMEVKVSYSELNNKYPVFLQLTDDVYGEIFTTPIEIKPAVNPKEITLTLPASTYTMLKADGAEHTLTARIIREDCHKADKGGENSTIYTAPGVPKLEVSEPVVPTPDCDQTTFSLEVPAKFAYLKGSKLEFYWDGVLHSEATITGITYGAPIATPILTKLTNLTYDGNPHTLEIRTDNTEFDCQVEFKDIKVPFSPHIYDYSATPTQMDCDIKEYEIAVDFFVTNGQGKKVTVQGKGQTKPIDAVDGKNTVTFEGIQTDTEEDFFEIWFEDATNTCKKKVSYSEPVTPHISLTQGPAFDNPDCNKTTYSVKFDVSYINQNGKLYAWIDNDESTKKEFSYKENLLVEDKVTIEMQNLAGDGLEHTFHVRFDGDHGCELSPKTYKAPFAPTITEVNINRNEMKCGETTFKVTVAATLSENAIGRKLFITGDTGTEPTTYDITATKFSHEFTVNRSEATGIFHIYFEDAENCASQKTKEYTYIPPKVPALSIHPVTVPKPTCDQTTFDLEISGSYTYLHGTELQFLWDGVVITKQPITPLTVGTISAKLEVAYDGASHVLKVQSNDEEYDICPFEQKDIEVPFSPRIDVPNMEFSTSGECTDETATLIFDLEYTYQQGKLLYNVDGGPDSIKDITEQSSLLTFTGLKYEGIPADGKTDHVLNIVFNGANSCEGSFALPQAPSSPVINSVTQAFKPEFIPG
ncbi:MAG: hypothetical protein IJP45_00190, partial [Paludibacteraceae bacterium]|nr:hypothetical protein [Paludibacteraceae bacterium]